MAKKTISINAPEFEVMEFTIKGTTPLILHAWDEKAKRMMREILLRNAMRELEAFRRKYARLTELAQVFEAIDKTVV